MSKSIKGNSTTNLTVNEIVFLSLGVNHLEAVTACIDQLKVGQLSIDVLELLELIVKKITAEEIHTDDIYVKNNVTVAEGVVVAPDIDAIYQMKCEDAIVGTTFHFNGDTAFFENNLDAKRQISSGTVFTRDMTVTGSALVSASLRCGTFNAASDSVFQRNLRIEGLTHLGPGEAPAATLGVDGSGFFNGSITSLGVIAAGSLAASGVLTAGGKITGDGDLAIHGKAEFLSQSEPLRAWDIKCDNELFCFLLTSGRVETNLIKCQSVFEFSGNNADFARDVTIGGNIWLGGSIINSATLDRINSTIIADNTPVPDKLEGTVASREGMFDALHCDRIDTREVTTAFFTTLDADIDKLRVNQINIKALAVEKDLKAKTGEFEAVRADLVQTSGVKAKHVTSTGGAFETLESHGIVNTNFNGQQATLQHLTTRTMEADEVAGKEIQCDKLNSDYSVLSTARVHDLDATDARVTKLDAQSATMGTLKASHIDIESLELTHLKSGHGEFTTASVGKLSTKNIKVSDVSSGTGTIAALTANGIANVSLTSKQATIHTLSAQQLTATTVACDSIEVQDITADTGMMKVATIDDLTATVGTVDHLTALNATVDDLKSNSVTSGSVESTTSNTTEAVIETATIDTVVSHKVNTASLTSKEGKFETVTADALKTTSVHATTITAAHATLAGSLIESAIVGDLRGERVAAGTVDVDSSITAGGAIHGESFCLNRGTEACTILTVDELDESDPTNLNKRLSVLINGPSDKGDHIALSEDGRVEITSRDGQPIVFGNDGESVAHVDGLNFGIGVAKPEEQLHVQKNTLIGGDLHVVGTITGVPVLTVEYNKITSVLDLKQDDLVISSTPVVSGKTVMVRNVELFGDTEQSMIGLSDQIFPPVPIPDVFVGDDPPRLPADAFFRGASFRVTLTGIVSLEELNKQMRLRVYANRGQASEIVLNEMTLTLRESDQILHESYGFELKSMLTCRALSEGDALGSIAVSSNFLYTETRGTNHKKKGGQLANDVSAFDSNIDQYLDYTLQFLDGDPSPVVTQTCIFERIF